MTGSAFAILSRAGRCILGWLRRITYFSTEPRDGERSCPGASSGRLADDGKRLVGVLQYAAAQDVSW